MAQLAEPELVLATLLDRHTEEIAGERFGVRRGDPQAAWLSLPDTAPDGLMHSSRHQPVAVVAALSTGSDPEPGHHTADVVRPRLRFDIAQLMQVPICLLQGEADGGSCAGLLPLRGGHERQKPSEGTLRWPRRVVGEWGPG